MRKHLYLLILGIALGTIVPAQAQWLTQSITNKPGWNSLFLHGTSAHSSIDSLVPTEVEEIWLWQPEISTLQFIQSPQAPVAGSQWLVWKRGKPLETTLNSLPGHSAYLVKLADPLPNFASEFVWSLKGVPKPPSYVWTSSGLNFIGYQTPDVSPPDLEAFLAKGNGLLHDLEHYFYPGGALGSTNPRKVLALRNTPVRRGEAFWVRSKSSRHNSFFGTFEVNLSDTTGIHFNTTLARSKFQLRNLTTNSLTVTMQQIASETPPGGQSAIAGTLPLILRGALNATNLTYAFSQFTGQHQVTLAPSGQAGASVDVVIGLNRQQMNGATGSLYAGVLRMTDNLGFTRMDFPMTALKESDRGLWVGSALVTQVRHDLTYFARNNAGATTYNTNGLPTVLSNNVTFGTTPRAFPLRVIMHLDTNGTARLLQRAFVGLKTNGLPVVATAQSLLHPSTLGTARRVSSSTLPWTKANTPFDGTGNFGPGGTVQVTVGNGHNSQASNPFLHTYHPDHDNRNATFNAFRTRGEESYDVDRAMAFQFHSRTNGFDELTSGHTTASGLFTEAITVRGKGSETKQYAVSGEFTLNLISTADHLTR